MTVTISAALYNEDSNGTEKWNQWLKTSFQVFCLHIYHKTKNENFTFLCLEHQVIFVTGECHGQADHVKK
jgi:hypothetical protein